MQHSGNIQDFGMDTISLAGTLEAKLQAVREAGFSQIMLSARDLVGHPQGLDAAVAAVKGSGLRVTGFQVLRDFEGLTGHLHDYKVDIAKSMLEMCSALGAKVLQVRSVELAMVHKVRTYVRSSFDDPASPQAGTLICDEEEIVEQQVVTGIAFSKDEAQITLRRVADKPGVAAAIFGPLADQNINVDMIIQVVSGNTGNGESMTTDMTFTVQAADYERAMALLTKLKLQIAYQAIEGATDVVKISAIGVGMRSHAGVAARAFRALAEKGVNIRAITTSEIKFSVLIDKDYTELAVRTLHSLYGLDKVA
jgi:aspartate kinase